MERRRRFPGVATSREATVVQLLLFSGPHAGAPPELDLTAGGEIAAGGENESELGLAGW